MNLDKEKNGVGSNPASFFFFDGFDGWLDGREKCTEQGYSSMTNIMLLIKFII